ncbi:MAG: universal stress protein [Capsulimonadales bacterium]|nr:universal stress protein [Capsulimonadales bacterium]
MRVLLATDGSERALTAARFLSGFPHRREVYVHILTVADSERPSEASAALTAAKAALGEFAGHITTAVGRGDSASGIVGTILDTADYTDADLIALGASGKSALARFFLGSIAEAVSRYAEQSILLTRPPVGPLRSVVLGADGSEEAGNALRFLISELWHPSAVLHLVRAIPSGGRPPEELSRETDAAKTCLAEMAETARAGGLTVGVCETPLGNPAMEILRVAEEQGAGLIVVGSQGLTGVDAFRLGSVAERLLRHAPMSVLVVKRIPTLSELAAV